MEDLPTHFDIIVVGTGMPECIIAAAAARVGKKILHLDRNGYYGSDWASFSYDKFMEFIDKAKHDENTGTQDTLVITATDLLQEGENSHICPSLSKSITNISFKPFIKETSDSSEEKSNIAEASSSQSRSGDGSGISNETNDTVPQESSDIESTAAASLPENLENNALVNSSSILVTEGMEVDQEWTLNSFNDNRRKFNIDLTPKLLFARGSLVELLISSNIARYAEFQCISRVLTYFEGRVEQVPCSRADVFSTKNVTVVEKRMLMKFLTLCLKAENQEDEIRGFEDKPFIEFLRSKKLTKNVEHYIVHAIAMVDETCNTIQGFASTKKFLESLGRYGKTPFLCTCYGSAELPQCFCRLCAVYEGMYYLKRQADAVITKDGKCSGIISMGQRINCEWLVMESGYAPSNFYSADMINRISRAILITDASICPSERKESTILRLPPGSDQEYTITMIELSSKNYVCPEDLYLVYLYCRSSKPTAEDDLRPIVDLLFNIPNSSSDGDGKSSLRPNLLWSVYYNQQDTSCANLNAHVPQGIFLTSSPDIELDYDHSVAEAQKIFSAMFPNEEFLPRAPDPEDIVIESGNPGDDSDDSKIENDVKEEASGKNVSSDDRVVGKNVGQEPEGNVGNQPSTENLPEVEQNIIE